MFQLQLTTTAHTKLGHILVMMLLLPLASQLPDSVWSADSLPPIDFVIAGIRHHFENIDRASGVISLNQSVEPKLLDVLNAQTGGGIEATEAWTYFWYIDSPNLFLSMAPGNPKLVGGKRLSRHVMVRNGDKFMAWREYRFPDDPKRSPLLTGVYGPAQEFMEEELPKSESMKDPRYYGYFRGDKFLGELLALSQPTTKILRTEEFDGAKCVVIEVQRTPGRRSIMWIDMEHGFMIRKALECEYLGNRERTLEDFAVHSIVGGEGKWLPSKVSTRVTFWNRETGDNLGSATIAVTVNRIVIGNEVPPSIFDISFPLGTIVSDRFREKEFIVMWSDVETSPADGHVENKGNE